MDNIEPLVVPTLPAPPLRNCISNGILLFRNRYNSAHRKFLQEVSKTMIWTVMACALGFSLQCYQMVELKIVVSFVLTMASMMLTHYKLFRSYPASRQLQCFGLFSGFLLESFVKSYCSVLGSGYWKIFLKGFVAYGMLIMSALFTSSEGGVQRPKWISYLGNVHVPCFLITYWPSLLRLPVIGVLVLILHIASCFFAINFNMRYVLNLVRDGRSNKVLCAMILFIDLYSLMTNTLIASTIRTLVNNRSSEFYSNDLDF